jgi:hypothetical protein
MSEKTTKASKTTGTIKKAVDSFQGIIDQKKKAMEEAMFEAEKTTRVRQDRLIQALVKVRKALRDVAALDMGKRFYLEMKKDDWEGWPRIILRLVDSENPTGELPELVVISHDRQDSGTLEIKYANKLTPITISLADEKQVAKVSNVLKKCLRDHLEMVGDLVVDIEQSDGAKRYSSYDDEDKQESNSEKSATKNENSDNINLSIDA